MNIFSRLKSLFTPSVIDIIPPDPENLGCPMGLKLVAIDELKTRWTLVEGRRGARCNRSGHWFLSSEHMNESFVFTLDEAKAMAEQQKNG